MGSTCSTEPQNNKSGQHDSTKQVRFPSSINTQEKEHNNSEGLDVTPHTPTTMSRRKAPTRTISVLKQQEDEECLKRNPDMKEVLAQFDDVRQRVEELIEQKEEFDDFEDLHKLFEKKILQPFMSLSEDEQRSMMGNHLAKIGFIKPLVDLYRKILQDHDILYVGISPELYKEDEDEEYFQVIMDIRTILWNFSDTSKDFGLVIAEQTNLFQFLIKDLQATYKEGLENLKSSEFCFNSAVAIITNCGRAGANKSSFQVELMTKDTDPVSVHMVDVLIPFLQSKEQFVKLTTLLALSYMVNENQNNFLTADTSLFDFLLDMIKVAMKEKDNRYQGFSVHELIDGLAGLAKNDENKVKIMEKKDTYPLLKDSVIKSTSVDQQLAAVRAIWELAFAEKNKKKFSSDKELMTQLAVLQKHDNQDLANSSGRAMFVINPDNEKNLMKSVDDKRSNLEQPEKEHIMISYQWGNQKVILQLRDKLRENNFPVWIDVDFMEGSMLQMMASAIEKSAVVLCCYAEKYKDSKNCRTEAEYAFARDKMIIPCLLQNRYKPDGWLGILVGSKKFYDFSGKYDFEKKFRELKMELEGVMRPEKRRQSLATIPSQPQLLSSGVPIDDQDIVLLRWKKQDIKNWLQKNNLHEFSFLHELTGEQLGFLYKIYVRAPDTFYRYLETKLGLQSLKDIMKFDRAIETLSQQHPEINKLIH